MNTSSKHNQAKTKRSELAIYHHSNVALSGGIYLINTTMVQYLTINHGKVPNQQNEEKPILIGLGKAFDKF